MFKKITIPVVILVVLIAAGLLWRQYAPKKEEGPKTTGKLMKVACNYWPGLYWIDIADTKGWFEEAGLNVELVNIAEDYVGGMQDMVDGKIDAFEFILFDLMKFNVEGSNLVMVIYNDTSFGADIIVAKKEIENIAGLKGKKIGVRKGSFQEYVLDVVLERNGLIAGDVVKLETKAENPKPFIEGSIDAFVTWEPHATEAMKKGNGRNIFDSSEIPGLLPEGTTFHQSFIEERPGDVHAYVSVWHKTTQFIKENPREAFGIIAEIYGVTPAEVQALTQVDKIMDLRDNLTAFSYGAGFESLHGTAREINNFMIKKGMTKKQLDSTEFLDARFIRALKR